jgi:hypothetical protein
MDLLPDRKLTK